MRKLMFLLALAAGPAMAQQDPMELQRCVWRCLADSPGNDSPEYNQCVAAKCSEVDAAASDQQVLEQPSEGGADVNATQTEAQVRNDGKVRLEAWTYALASDGQRYFAGAVAKQDGRSFYYICTPEGQSYFAIFGLTIGAAQLRLKIDDIEYLTPFDWVNGEYRVELQPDSTLMQALRTNNRGRLRIQDASGKYLVAVALRGSTEALDAAIASCFG